MTVFLDDIEVGTEYISETRTIARSDIERFADLSGDFNPLHVDEEWVRANTDFDRCIAHGLLMLGHRQRTQVCGPRRLAHPGVPRRRTTNGWPHLSGRCRPRQISRYRRQTQHVAAPIGGRNRRGIARQPERRDIAGRRGHLPRRRTAVTVSMIEQFEESR